MESRDNNNVTDPRLLETGSDERGISRRELLKRAGAAGVALSIPAMLVIEDLKAAAVDGEPEQFKSFTPAQAATMKAAVARLIPKDENGPGALEAGVPRYIDRLLSNTDTNTFRAPNNPDHNLTDAYAAGLKAIDAYAQSTHAAPFASLSPDYQDAILTDMQANRASGFTPDSRMFFNLLRQHAVEGMFCDPYYGGNVNFVGWDLVNYPGIKLVFTAEEQKMGVEVKSVHKGTTDYAFFGNSRKGM